MTGRLIAMPMVQERLLDAVAAVPRGVRISIPQLRDHLVNQGDVLNALQALVTAGKLDPTTLRPPLAPMPHQRGGRAAAAKRKATQSTGLPTGAELADELGKHAKRHGLAISRVSRYLFGGSNGYSRLRKLPTPKTVDNVRAFIAGPIPSEFQRQLPGGPRVAKADATGRDLADQVEAVIAEHGLSKHRVGTHLYGNRHGVDVLRQSNPRQSTVDRVRAFLANPPIDDLKPRDGWTTRRANQALREGGAGDGGTPSPAPELPLPATEVEPVEPGGCAPPVYVARPPAGKSAAEVLRDARRVPLKPTISPPPASRVDPKRDTPLPTFLKNGEIAWCSQCEQRVGEAKAAQCLSRWCDLKVEKSA